MKKLYSLIAALAVLTLAATPAIAQTAIKPDGTQTELKADANGSLIVSAQPYQGSATVVGATQAGAATALSGTLGAGGATKRTYICGLVVTGAGATATSTINVTITNAVIGSGNFRVVIPAGATTSIIPLVVNFAPCIPAGALNQGIGISVPSFGVGNTDAAFSAWGYHQ